MGGGGLGFGGLGRHWEGPGFRARPTACFVGGRAPRLLRLETRNGREGKAAAGPCPSGRAFGRGFPRLRKVTERGTQPRRGAEALFFPFDGVFDRRTAGAGPAQPFVELL